MKKTTFLLKPGDTSMLNRFTSFLKDLPFEVEITFEKPSDIRSVAFNRYYWGVLIKEAREHFGYTREQMHAVFKNMFIDPITIENKLTGEVIEERTTTKHTTAEFYKYVEDIKLYLETEHNFFLQELPE